MQGGASVCRCVLLLLLVTCRPPTFRVSITNALDGFCMTNTSSQWRGGGGEAEETKAEDGR